MIKNIKMKSCATYSDVGVSIDDCKKINFIYGPNGSGKSTIGKFLYNQNDAEYSCCEAEMHINSDADILVYNKDFKTRNIVENIDGIFTLGEATIEDINKLNEMKKEYGLKNEKLQNLEIVLNNKMKEYDNLNDAFRDSVWEDILKQNDKEFKDAFTGYRNSKEKFYQFVLEKYQAYKNMPVVTTKVEEEENTITSKDKLLARSNTLFSTELKMCELIEFSFKDRIPRAQEIETDSIWGEVIVGNRDLPISKLIDYLHNADWVNKGREFLRDDGICPFCQSETITEEFVEHLNAFFSGEYESKVEKIKTIQLEYEAIIELVKRTITDILSNDLFLEIGEIDRINLSSLLATLEKLFDNNKMLIMKKGQEPGSKIDLSSTISTFNQIVETLQNANKNIEKSNKLIENKEAEKKKLINDIWMYLMKKYSKLIAGHMKKMSDCKKGINGISINVKNASDALKIQNDSIIEAGRNITSIQPTVNEINRLLLAYGFDNFKIVSSKVDENSYQIQRPDGSLATNTLSEGEETFISFLYFMQFAKGSWDKDKISNKKIMILDDPISSLDSTILYIVSSMVKALIKEIREGESDVEQLFILTHNVFFHKEASFVDGRNDEGL